MTDAISNRGNWFARLGEFLGMIKVAHTLFAMPFAIGAVFLAHREFPDDEFPIASLDFAILLSQVMLAVALARTAAMSFNRWADRDLDRLNPRTSGRSIPAGRLGAATVLWWAVGSSAGFVAVTATINPLALQLSPAVLLVVLGYSWTKRFTSLCHLVLGLGLALAPIGAWVAVRGTLLAAEGGLDPVPWILGGSVLLWTAGFDILYACQDHDFDLQQRLHSLPTRFGIRSALRLSQILHFLMVGLLVTLWDQAHLGIPFAVAIIIVSLLLVAEHRLVKADDLTRVQSSFFTLNAIISSILMVALMVEGWSG
ncbi:MAG: putative 4-hydroxybenzoate polyprenyltransferase [Planctomycetota bacterium]|nr:putative 4-hydroxybenzoate polyprenyltransferase [Planctomycetota bacterium]